jgi:hypothetical protein
MENALQRVAVNAGLIERILRIGKKPVARLIRQAGQRSTNGHAELPHTPSDREGFH